MGGPPGLLLGVQDSGVARPAQGQPEDAGSGRASASVSQERRGGVPLGSLASGSRSSPRSPQPRLVQPAEASVVCSLVQQSCQEVESMSAVCRALLVLATLALAVDPG